MIQFVGRLGVFLRRCLSRSEGGEWELVEFRCSSNAAQTEGFFAPDWSSGWEFYVIPSDQKYSFSRRHVRLVESDAAP